MRRILVAQSTRVVVSLGPDLQIIPKCCVLLHFCALRGSNTTTKVSLYSGCVFYQTSLCIQTARYTNYTQMMRSIFLYAFNPRHGIDTKLQFVSLEKQRWRFRHRVRCKQSRHVYSVEGDSKRSVKVQHTQIKGRTLLQRRVSRPKQKQKQKIRNTWR